MSNPVLYMLNPWYDAPDQGPFYCPDCGIVEGFFIYNPKIKEQVDIIHVDFQRPRPENMKHLISHSFFTITARIRGKQLAFDELLSIM